MLSSTTLHLARRSLSATASMSVRSLSSQCEPAEKLRLAFQEYRNENFTRCLPTRYQREMMKAIPTNDDGRVLVDSLNRILVNIGRPDQVLSERELQTLLEAAETGDTQDRTIASHTVLELV